MGLPGFSTWFSKKAAPEAFQPVNGREFDHVYVDLASVLHGVLRKAKNPGQIHKLLFGKLDQLLRQYRPRHTFLLAMDGPAPLAKLLTQRSRRLSTGRRESIGKTKGMSSLGLTPGTPMMAQLEASLEFYISQRLKKWSHVQFELSGTTVPGEGEVKIFNRLLHPLPGSSPAHTYAVVGADSDLYLMALSLRPSLDNLWIVPEVEYPTRFVSGFSLGALEKSWSKKEQVAGSGSSEVAARRLANLKTDMAALAIMANGNDYLPGVPYLSMDSSFKSSLWDAFLRFKNRPEWTDRPLVVIREGCSRLDREVFAALLQSINSASTRDKDGISPTKPKPKAAKYIQGLEWVLDMYRTGICSDYRFVYDNQSPSKGELLDYLKEPAADAQTTSQDTEASTSALTSALTPAVFAMALLPPGSGRPHAPLALQSLMDEGSPIADLYHECQHCQEIAIAGRDARHNLLKAVNQLSRAVAKEEEAQKSKRKAAGGSPPAPPEPAAPVEDPNGVTACNTAMQAARDACRRIDRRRMQHTLKAHPYQRFPIERIEAAVADVPLEDYSDEERENLEFGSSYAYWKRSKTEECCCPACSSNSDAGNRAQSGSQACHYAFPLPDSPNPNSRLEPPTQEDGLRRAPIDSATLARARSTTASSPASTSCQCPRCRQIISRPPSQELWTSNAPTQRLHANKKRRSKSKGPKAPARQQRATPVKAKVQKAMMKGGPKFGGLPLNINHQQVAIPRQASGMGAFHTSTGRSYHTWEVPAICWQPAAVLGPPARSTWHGGRPGFSTLPTFGRRSMCCAAQAPDMCATRPPLSGAFHRHMLQPRHCSQMLQVVRQICRR